jgi:hypothetical protein
LTFEKVRTLCPDLLYQSVESGISEVEAQHFFARAAQAEGTDPVGARTIDIGIVDTPSPAAERPSSKGLRSFRRL